MPSGEQGIRLMRMLMIDAVLFTALGLFGLSGTLAGTAPHAKSGPVHDALERVGLATRMTHRPSELSCGEQQRAALARALINQPKLLLADEPTGNLDSRTGTEIMNFIREFNQSLGMTIVMVTHERALAERYARRMIFLADGKLVENRPNGDQSNPAVVASSLQGERR